MKLKFVVPYNQDFSKFSINPGVSHNLLNFEFVILSSYFDL